MSTGIGASAAADQVVRVSIDEGPLLILHMMLAFVGHQGCTTGGTGLQGWQEGKAFESKIPGGGGGGGLVLAHCDRVCGKGIPVELSLTIDAMKDGRQRQMLITQAQHH